jgi:two-component system, chemotaxis family, sensor kinase CheA
VPPMSVQPAHELASEQRGDAAPVARAPSRSPAPVERHGDYPLEAVLVRLGDQLYGLPTSHVEAFLQPDTAALREVPFRGTLLVTEERGLLPLARLEVLLGHAPDPMPIDQRVAVVVGIASRRSAVLVDEVLTQGRLLVKCIEPNYRAIPGVAGAALVDDKLALVLSLERLLELAPA